ncbi:MAG: PilZ domain-containing protein [bacterium]|nr:PilZ domain-containing protein [bacterium]
MAEEEFEVLGKDSGQNRGFARTEERFPVEFEMITEQELPAFKKLYESKRTVDREQLSGMGGEETDQFLALGASQSQILLFQKIMGAIRQLEEKLDNVLSAVSGKKAEQSKKSKGMCVDLSAGGMRMIAAQKFSKGDLVSVLMTLPPQHPAVVGAIGKVVKLGEVQLSSGRRATEVALHFEAIHEMDREDVVAYNFKRQREEAHKAQQSS